LRRTVVHVFFFQAEDGIRDDLVTGVQTCALPILSDEHPHVHGFLPDDHPHPQLYHGVTPIWHDGESPEDLDDRFGEGYTCGFSTGFERGIVTIMMKPEWAVGWYRALRQYYLASNHPPDDLQSWERCAEETARA